MKKNRVCLFRYLRKCILPLFLLLFFFVSSCDNTELTVELANSTLNDRYLVLYSSTNLHFDVWGNGQEIIIGKQSLKDIRCLVDEKDYLRLIDDFQITKYATNPVQIIFYVVNAGYEKIHFSKEHVIGISIYDLKDSKLYHSFIETIPTGFENNSFYNCEVSGINHNLTDFLLEVEMHDKISNQANIISFIKSNLEPLILNDPKDESFLRMALKRKILIKSKRIMEHQNHLLGTAPGNGGEPTGCGVRVGCENGTPEQVCRSQSPVSVPSCFNENNSPGKCQDADNFDLIIGSGDTSLAVSAHNFNLHYNFRDNFLIKTIFGKSYDTYFYALDQYVQGQISIQLALETADFLIDFNQIIVKLLNPMQYGDNILLTPTQKNKLITLLNNYKVLNPDIYYQMMIDDIIDDVNFYCNRTILQFYNDIYLNLE